MALIRLQDNTPDIYVDNSRDFQLLCRLYDCINNGVKYSIDSITSIIDTETCNARLLQLLQTKLGFITDAEIDNESLRYILRAFPEIMKNKGSKKAITEAVNVFAKVKNIKANIDCLIINKQTRNSVDYDVYKIQIIINANPSDIPLVKDTTILDEIFKYIIPTGYTIEYIFSTGIEEEMLLDMTDDVAVFQFAGTQDSRIRGENDAYVDDTAMYRITTAADTANTAGTPDAEGE